MPPKTRKRTTVRPTPIAAVTTPDGTTIGPPSNGMFHFRSSAGEITLPSLAKVDRTFAMMEAVADGNTAVIVVRIVQAAADPESLAVVRQLRQSELTELFAAWSKYSGITVGNSPAS